jgi:F-type H+-transporting ATPase subunit a
MAGSGLGAGAGLGVAVPVVLGSVAITMLEIFVAFLQAFIFTFLTTLFIGQSVVFHHGDDHEHGDGHGEGAHAH